MTRWRRLPRRSKNQRRTFYGAEYKHHCEIAKAPTVIWDVERTFSVPNEVNTPKKVPASIFEENASMMFWWSTETMILWKEDITSYICWVIHAHICIFYLHFFVCFCAYFCAFFAEFLWIFFTSTYAYESVHIVVLAKLLIFWNQLQCYQYLKTWNLRIQIENTIFLNLSRKAFFTHDLLEPGTMILLK